MNDFKFILERFTKPSSRYTCPSCEKVRQFTRYISTETGEHVSERVGRCNHENSCSYHYTPKQYFADHPDGNSPTALYRPTSSTKLAALKPIIGTLPSDVVERSLGHYANNAFVRGLSILLTEEVALDLACRYYIGTARGGGTIFWQVDELYKARTGKIISYDAETLNRLKKNPDGSDIFPQWAHTKLRQSDFHLRQCLFGQHLLTASDSKPIAVVESEKTAVICSVYLPEFLWMATGGCGAPQFKYPEVLTALRHREIHLFPDTGATDKWNACAKEMHKAMLRVQVHSDLEDANLGRPSNWDLADEFLAFAQPIMLETGPVRWAITEPNGYPIFWDYPVNNRL
ncbi:hypothetical protein I2I05_05135 [Hymenobacter sp. BT683]|uniref:DUF3854 domain-containing protein n=1 Tax=Hymenobacter jeongseonensis TaxID=2791027 RepID=A0ABS0IF24_9BACT|nr:DUF6371 domain-containing protein [Hymenobacter jeongseonensis]MBF9236772.1 hypothetical protein [Hymenobacter jeongseonensis]